MGALSGYKGKAGGHKVKCGGEEVSGGKIQKGCGVGCGFHVVVGHGVNGNLVLGPRLRKKRFVVLWVVFFFGSVGRNCIKKQPKGSVFGTIFIPFCTSWVPKGV